MFTMILERKDGSPLVLRYDPHASTLTHTDGAPVNLSPVGMAPMVRERRPVERVHPEVNQLPKSRHLKTVRILFGLACNYACAYCSQAVSRAAEDGRESADDVDAFLDHLPEWLHAGTDEPVRFEFWGGESFVYWKKIERMARRLRALYPNAVMWIPTNGSLFDQEKVTFLVEHGISVSISHDGPGQHLRGPDPFDDPGKAAAIRAAADALAPLGRIAINSVLTREHHSLLALRDFFAERFAGGWLPQLVTEGLVMTHRPGDLLLSPVGENEHRRIRRTLFADMARPDMIPMSFVSYKLRQLFDSLATARHSACLGQRCGMDRPDSIAVRLNGDVIICPNGTAPTQVLGSVHDFDAIRLRHSTHWSYRDECRHCPALQLCGGACMMFADGSGKHRGTCDNSFTVEIAYLALALYLLTDARMVRIEADQIRFPGVTAFDF
jgi:uncharacterized protein